MFKAVAGAQWTVVAPRWQLTTLDPSLQPLKPGDVRLHWDVSNSAAQQLIVYGNMYVARASTNPNIVATDTDYGIQYHNTFFSRVVLQAARLSAAGDQWLPAYGGGFTEAPQCIESFYNSQRVYFIGTTGFVYQRYAVSASFYSSELQRWTDPYESPSTPSSPVGLPLNGGDLLSIATAGTSKDSLFFFVCIDVIFEWLKEDYISFFQHRVAFPQNCFFSHYNQNNHFN